MKAIILAAGVGSRLEEGKALPKCLIKIDDETILERQIRILNNLEIDDILLVIGSQGECWTKENIEKISKIHNKIVVNKKNIDLKRAYTLFCGLSSIEKDDIIILDGDLVFEKKLIEKIISDKRENLVLSVYIESRNVKNKGAKLSLDKNKKITSMGYDVSSNALFSGIFKICKRDFDLFKQIVSQEESWNKNLSKIIEEFSKKTEVYAEILNTSISVIQEREVKAEESWEPSINYIERKNGTVRKKTKIGKLKLINEVNFIQELPDNIKTHFPRIIGCDFDQEVTYYDMEYCPYPNLLDLIFNREINLQKSIEILKPILDFVFNDLYKINVKKTPPGFIKDSYFNKVKQRFNAVKGRSALFDKIASTDYLTINGKKLKNFPLIFEEIKNDIKYLADLEPPFVSMYHGDFQFNNMLVGLKNKDFILLDPRGKTAAGHNESDPLEDIAKLFATCRGDYSIFDKGLFKVDIRDMHEMIIDYEIKAKDVANLLNEIANSLIQILPSYNQFKNDENWKRRLLFVGSLFFIANAPFHLTSKENENFSIMLLVRGIELLNEFIEKYPLNTEEKFNLINVNTPEELSQLQYFHKEDFKNPSNMLFPE